MRGEGVCIAYVDCLHRRVSVASRRAVCRIRIRRVKCTHEFGADRLSPHGRVRRLFRTIAKFVLSYRRVVQDGRQQRYHVGPQVFRFGSTVQYDAVGQGSGQFRILFLVNW